jgi:hypothetical protein
MKKIKLSDCMFGTDGYSSGYQYPKYFDWDRSPINSEDKLIFITEYNLGQINQTADDAITFAWFLESPEVAHNGGYEAMIKHLKDSKFTYILANSKELLYSKELTDKVLFCPTGGCWIKLEDQSIYEKNKLVSIIASGKDWTSGHKVRLEVVSKFYDKMDVYGSRNPISYKLTGLKDYAFSLVVENTKKDYYFSEKLIDCFMTGTIPIYWGCPSIDKFFNINGMILFNTIDELPKILDEISFDKYIEMKDAIEENFEKAKTYILSEDFIYENYLKNKFI